MQIGDPVSYTHLDVYKRQVDLFGRIVGDALADHLAGRHHLDRVAGVEAALHPGDTDRQQARPAAPEHLRGPVIDDDPPVGRLRVLEPLLEARGRT